MAQEADDIAPTFDITARALGHAPAALRELARLAGHAESEAARIAAIKEMLALAGGKAMKTAAAGDGPLVVKIVDDWARPAAAAAE